MKKFDKKIIHCIDSLSIGGAESLLVNTIALLSEFEHIVLVLSDKGEATSFLNSLRVKVISLEYKGWSNVLSSVYKLRSIILQREPLLVHSHLFYSTCFARLATPAHIPLISSIHSVYSIDAFEKNKGSLWAERFLIKKRQSVIGVSSYVLKDYLKFVPFRGKQFVLHNFLPCRMFDKKVPSSNKGTIKCVAIGNLKEVKNYHYLLKIFSLLKELNLSLDIYGIGGLEGELQEIINKNNLNIRLCGLAADIPQVMKSYDYFIQASSHEGFGLSVIEAMATGIPVILSDIPVFHEITDDICNFFPLNDAKKAAEVLKCVFENSIENLVKAEKGFLFVKKNYSASRYKEQLLHIYENITQQKLLSECVESQDL